MCLTLSSLGERSTPYWEGELHWECHICGSFLILLPCFQSSTCVADCLPGQCPQSLHCPQLSRFTVISSVSPWFLHSSSSLSLVQYLHCLQFSLITVLSSLTSLSLYQYNHCPQFSIITVLNSVSSLSLVQYIHCP